MSFFWRDEKWYRILFLLIKLHVINNTFEFSLALTVIIITSAYSFVSICNVSSHTFFKLFILTGIQKKLFYLFILLTQ